MIDKEKYAKATQGEIRSELLILTEKQKAHIIDRRGQEFFEKYTCFFAQIAIDPDFIFLDKKHVNSAFACKTLTQCGMNLLLVIRLAIVDDRNRLSEVVDFVATTRSMSQKGRRRTLRLPDSHSWGAAFEWLLFFFVFTVQMLKKANHLIPSHAPSLPSRQRRPIIRWEACGFAEFGDSNLWSPNSCSVRRQQPGAGSACRQRVAVGPADQAQPAICRRRSWRRFPTRPPRTRRRQ